MFYFSIYQIFSFMYNTAISHSQTHPASRAPFCLLEWKGEKTVLRESRQAFEVAAAQTSGLLNLAFSRQTGLFQCEHPLIDKPKVIAKPAVSSTRL